MRRRTRGWPDSSGSPPTATMLRRYSDAENIDRAVRWLLSFPDIFLCSVGETTLPPMVLEAAIQDHGPTSRPTEEEMEKMRSELGLSMPGPREWPRLWD